MSDITFKHHDPNVMLELWHVTKRFGGLTAVDGMNHFLLNKEVALAGSTYWNMVYGKDPGDVRRDDEGMRNMRNLGENLAWLMWRLAS